MALDWLLVLPVVWGEPSPQSIAYAQGASLTPGSLKVALSVTGLPNVTVWFGPAFTVGATLPIVAGGGGGGHARPRAAAAVGGTADLALFAHSTLGREAGRAPPPPPRPGPVGAGHALADQSP